MFRKSKQEVTLVVSLKKKNVIIVSSVSLVISALSVIAEW